MVRLAALMPLALVACVDTGDEGMFVLNNTAVSGTTCALTGSPDQPFISHGQINWQSPNPYLLTPLLESRLKSIETNPDDAQKTIQLRGADVQLVQQAISIQHPDGSVTTSQAQVTLGMFSVNFAGALSPSGSVNVSAGIIPTSALFQVGQNAQAAGANLTTDTFDAEVVATVVVKGDLNGDEIKAPAYPFPVTVCNNCIVNKIGACPATGTVATGNPCNPFQDGVVDCCTNASNQLVCPAPTM